MKMEWKTRCCLAVFILALWIPEQAVRATSSSEVLVFVKESVDRVLSVLRNPAFEPEDAKELQLKELRALAREIFDFDELSRSALARNRTKFSPEELSEFSDLFPQLLEKTYMERIQTYTDEEVVYHDAIMLSDRKAEVATDIVTASKAVPITYRVLFRDGQWRIYDVLVEGVSLVKNYRSQFDQILRKEAPEALLQRLREKLEQQDA